MAARLDQLRVRQLKFLNHLAALGSLAATAELLALSPSAASMMLKEIESLFGAKLFVRKGRGMVPTAQGEALLPRCNTVLGEVAAIADTLTAGPAPVLRIGAFPHTTTTVLPRIVHALLQAPEGWQLDIRSDSADRLFEQLGAGEIDLLLGQLPKHAASSPGINRVGQHVIYRGQLVVVAARTHALARQQRLHMSDLLDWPWVLPAMQSTTRVALADAFLRLGLAPPTPRVVSPSFFYSLSLVAGSSLLTCCARSAAAISAHPTAILPVDVGLDPTPVSLFWRETSAEARRGVSRLKHLSALEMPSDRPAASLPG